MGGVTQGDWGQSVGYPGFFGQGRQEGRQECCQGGELEMAVPLRRRCGAISAEQEAGIRALSLERLEALADALLDFESPADLVAWLAAG